MTGTFELVASSPVMFNGASVSPAGRVFSSFPRWSDAPTPSVCEAMPDGTYRPFPGGDWHDWKPGAAPEQKFVSVHATFCDKYNNLWVIDDAAAFHQPSVPGGPKLVKIDLRTNKVARIYPFGPDLAPPGTILSHMRRDEHHAYVTDPHSGALTILDLATGKGRRVLARHPKMSADPSIIPVVDGKQLTYADGRQIILNVNLLEISNDGRWLYFMPLFGPWLRRIETRYLLDTSLSDEQLGEHIEDHVRVPPCAGVMIDLVGNLYFSSFTESAIRKLDTKGVWHTLVADPRISFPNEGEVGPDGYLYFPASQVSRMAALYADGVSRVQPPFELFRCRI